MSKCALCIEDLKKPGLQPHDEACKDHLVCNICSFSKRKSDDPTLCSYCGINGCCAVKELLLGGGTPDCDVIFVESTLSLCESCAEEPAMNSYACEHSLCIERFENCITVQTEIKQIPVSVLWCAHKHELDLMISLHGWYIRVGFAFCNDLWSLGGSCIQIPSGFSSPSEPQQSWGPSTAFESKIRSWSVCDGLEQVVACMLWFVWLLVADAFVSLLGP